MRIVAFMIDLGFWLIVRGDLERSEQEERLAFERDARLDGLTGQDGIDTRGPYWKASKMFNRNNPHSDELPLNRSVGAN